VPRPTRVKGAIALCRHKVRAVVGVLVALLCMQGHAQKPPDVTPGEVARLPAYCAESQSFAAGGFRGGPLPSQQPWVAKIGDGFWAVHHYCWAMLNANRASTTVVKQTREYLLHKAIDDCKYVVANTGADFVLLPEIYLRMGEYYEQLGQPAPALWHFERSQQTKPDYWPAYLRMAQLQAKLGRRAAAVATLSEGLKQAPQQAQLQAELARIGEPSAGKGRARASRPASGAAPK